MDGTPRPAFGFFGGYDDGDHGKMSRYITRNFGKTDFVFFERMYRYVLVDVNCIPGEGERKHYTFVTNGMGSEEMFVDDPERSRVELALYLSNAPEKEKIKAYSSFLINCTKIPFEDETFFAEGHTMEENEYNKETLFPYYDGFVFRQARTRKGRADAKVNLPFLNATVRFLDLIPVYREEFTLIHKDSKAFFAWLDKEYPDTAKFVDVKREKRFGKD